MAVDTINLYSPNLETRYQASIRYGEQNAGPFSYWDRGCWGAANGWLMLCGPSPGRADDLDRISSGGLKRPKDVPVRIGKEAGKIDFQSNKGRNQRWHKLIQAVFRDEEKSNCLTSVANLDWGNYSDYRWIPSTHLKSGCETVFGVMQTSKPCVVITLVAVTWNYLSEYLHDHLVTPNTPVPSLYNRKPLECRILQIPSCAHKTLLLKSPQHPSRPFFTDVHCQQITTAVSWFIETYLKKVA